MRWKERWPDTMGYKLAIFDFDGTLADTFRWFTGSVNGAAKKYTFKQIDKNDLETFRNTDATKLFSMFGVPAWKVPLIAGYMRKRMSENIDAIKLFAGMEAELEHVSKNGAILAVVSSNSRDNIIRTLGKAAALFNYFECGVSLSGKQAKIKKILRTTGFKPEETILVGDEIRDGEAARKAGVAFGAVAWGYNSFEALKALSPEVVFERVEEMAGKIGG